MAVERQFYANGTEQNGEARQTMPDERTLLVHRVRGRFRFAEYVNAAGSQRERQHRNALWSCER